MSPQVMENRPDRCYHCKRLIFASIVQLAADKGFRHVVDGTHTEDHGTDRPGLSALREMSIRSPLAEAGFTKEDVRRAAKGMGLEVAGKPSSPCLATRIPFNRPLDHRLLEQVDQAEGFLRDLGYRQVRVRHHGPIARIEVDPEDLARAVEDREAIITALTTMGFVYVVLDLKGFRSGSMSEGMGLGPS
jgi:pyridinium-3,5-biscarboxylic acid mononucleotide sulfurtransferase